MVWCGVVWCGVVWCGVVWCGVVWCGEAWRGMVWYGMVWCGVVWRGMVWRVMVWCNNNKQSFNMRWMRNFKPFWRTLDVFSQDFYPFVQQCMIIILKPGFH